eukprot:TRINITY_DN12851_c0_g1_i1.p1 TRINITY_DN12851_c0_g1~~TRINITY_DN12851_c0_g1_i1.p1  ORF type:complete len:225 (+),score=45.34 TRINITY_DN12851_c0_g1_i1:57-677(+)
MATTTAATTAITPATAEEVQNLSSEPHQSEAVSRSSSVSSGRSIDAEGDDEHHFHSVTTPFELLGGGNVALTTNSITGSGLLPVAPCSSTPTELPRVMPLTAKFSERSILGNFASLPLKERVCRFRRAHRWQDPVDRLVTDTLVGVAGRAAVFAPRLPQRLLAQRQYVLPGLPGLPGPTSSSESDRSESDTEPPEPSAMSWPPAGA